VLLAAVVPGGARGFMALLGAVAVSFGLVVSIEDQPHRLNYWPGVEARKTRRHIVRDEHRVVA
jgi:hypothetical protein